MGRLWEYESRTSQRDSRREDFTRSTRTSGLHKMIRDSLISRGLDPDIIPNLSAPPSVTKPVDREVVKDVVPVGSVRSAETALQTKPRTTFIETADPEKESGGGFLKRALGGAADIAGDVLSSAPVKTALSILDIADIPRREIGKPIARALLEPLALATEAADAISPDNLSVLPRIFPTGGQLRGATAVEVLSFITDPINLIPGIGFTKMAHLRGIAKVALKGGRLSLKDTQLLRKATPVARQMLVKEAEGPARKLTPAAKENLSKAGKRLGQIDDTVEENGRLMLAIEDRRKVIRPAEGPSFPEAWQRFIKLDDQLEAQYKAIEAQQLKLFEEYDSLKVIVDEAGGKSTRTLTGPEATRRIIGGDLPGTRTLSGEEARALTAKVPIHESNTVKNLRNTVAGEGHNPPPPPPPRLPGEPPPLLPGGQAPSISDYRTMESGRFLSSRSSDLMRQAAEVIGEFPAIKLFFKAVTGPASLARLIPEIRAGVMYSMYTGKLDAMLGQR